MNQFKFQLGDNPTISVSGEVGEVIGRAEYRTSENSYLLRYCDRQGNAQEQWWSESALV